MKSVSPRPDTDGTGVNVKRLGSDYRCYKEVNELEGSAKRFYEVVAEMAGLTVLELVRAVYSLELMLRDWQWEENRRLREEGEGDDERNRGSSGSQALF
jgi:RNA polymerase I-specific transcription initiation factor RRN7